jgi:drug/metabolite transporter (DMT)-like permease
LVAAVGFLGIPVVGLLSSWILLGEPLSLLDLCGALATFVGIVMVSVGSEASIASETLRAVTAVD